MRYAGTLFFDNSSDVLEVHSLIRRGSILRVQATCTLTTSGRWEIDTEINVEGATYVSTRGPSKRIPRTEHCVITLQVFNDKYDYIEMAGLWSENGEDYRFAGELELLSTNT